MARTDRNRLVDVRDGLDSRDRLGPDQTQRMMVQVYDGGAIPTTVPKVYLTHPALVDAADTEGASPSFVADTAVTIPVVVLGPNIPVALTRLVAHAIAGRWLAGDGGGPVPADCYPCAECAIPIKDLEFRIGTGGPTYTLYVQDRRGIDGTVAWSTGCQAGPASTAGDGSTDPNCAATQDEFTAGLICGGLGNPTLGIVISNSTHYPCTPTLSGNPPTAFAFGCFVCEAPSGKGLDLVDYACNPFSFHFRSNGLVSSGLGVDCPRVTAVLGDSDFFVYDPSPGGECPTDATINVLGCNELPLAGATVTVKTPGGTTVASGTTDGSGNFSFSGGQAAATVVVAASRFTTTTWTGQEVSVGAVVTLDMSGASGDDVTGTVADGYTCIQGCAYPLANMLTVTWDTAGAQTLSWTGSQWSVTFTVGGHVYVQQYRVDGTYSLTRDGVACSGLTVVFNACPLSFLTTWTLPDGDCKDDLGTTGTMTE